jgi:WD repeat-containing protein 19
MQVPELSVEYAQQLEFKGEYESALKMYESALNAVDADGRTPLCSDEQQTTCMAGIARCTLRLGDLRRGISYVREANDRKLCRECAAILESMNQQSEAASLYEAGELYEKARAAAAAVCGFKVVCLTPAWLACRVPTGQAA